MLLRLNELQKITNCESLFRNIKIGFIPYRLVHLYWYFAGMIVGFEPNKNSKNLPRKSTELH
jgi:hypothetical protein